MGVYGKSEKPSGPVDWRAPSVVLATGFWAGRIPWAPGTWGRWGLPLSWGIAFLPGFALQAAAIVAINLLGIPLCTAAARKFGGVKDPGAIVFDEIATIPVVFLFVPLLAVKQPLVVLAIGFALHRLFDITKPPPARQLERLPAGLGIMADDWAAGAFACLALHALHWSGLLRAFWP